MGKCKLVWVKEGRPPALGSKRVRPLVVYGERGSGAAPLARDQNGDLGNQQATPEFLGPRATCSVPCFFVQTTTPSQVVHVPAKTSSKSISQDRL